MRDLVKAHLRAPVHHQNSAAPEELGGQHVGRIYGSVDCVPLPIGGLEPDERAAGRVVVENNVVENSIVENNIGPAVAIHIQNRPALGERTAREGCRALAF